MYYESETLELKEKFSDSITRDIVAFLNTQGGILYVGISDNGKIIGLDQQHIDETQQRLSDIITNQIDPTPSNEIAITLINEDDKNIIKVTISKGFKPLYCIKKFGYSPKGCLIRIGTTCKEMSNEEIKYRYQCNFIDDDYILKAPAHYSPLSFEMMKILLTSKGYHVNQNAFETNFSLVRPDGSYNLMAEILADVNMTSLIFVKFQGNNKASISQRSDYGDQSILLGFQRLKDRLIAENICITNTSVRPRIDEYLYDMDCVNEALINAIVHNDWTISEPLVSFYHDRLEITSHGGIPKQITKEDFYNGISHPRNTVLMRIFLKLGIVEHTGHGIPKIIEKYGKGVFDIHDTYINVIIPFNRNVLTAISYNQYEDSHVLQDKPINIELSKNEKNILLELIDDPSIPYDTLVTKLNISRRTVSRVFNSLVEKEYIKRIGNNKTGYWKVIK